MTMASPAEDRMPTSGGTNTAGTASGTSSNTSTHSTHSWDLIPTTAAGNGLHQNAAAAAAFPWGYFNTPSAFHNNNTYPSTDFTGPWSTSWPHTDTRFQMNKFNVPCVSSTPYGFSAINAMNAAAVNSAMRSSGRRRRNLFTQDQVNKLKEAFHKETYVKPEHREALAQATGLTPQQVKIWFQNNRYKCKQKQKEDERSERAGGPIRGSMDPDSQMRARSRSPSTNSCNINMSGASSSPVDIKPPMHDDLGIGIMPILPQHGDLSDVKNVGDFSYPSDFKSLNAPNFAAMNAYSSYGMNMGLYGSYLPGMTAMGYPNPQNTAAGYQQY